MMTPHICLFATLLLAVGSSSCGGGAGGGVLPSLNDRATLNGKLPFNPLEWEVITSSVDKPASTMSTLYGNDIAVRFARSSSNHDYPAGSVLALVTWRQQEDARWFGGRIPGQVASVEFVSVRGAGNQSYENYAGSPLSTAPLPAGQSQQNRTAYLLSLRAAVMP